MTTATENKAAFIAAFKSQKHTTHRGTEHTARAIELMAGEAWSKHMKSVVTSKTMEAPVDPCQAPKWDDEYTASPVSGGYVLPKKEGVRVSVSVANQVRKTGKQNEWVVVELPDGPAAVTVEEAYSLGARELQSW